MQKLSSRTDTGFTLVELLIVVAIIGIIAAIAIPNLISAVQRGRQKRTMGDLKTVATTIETFNIDNSSYPNAGAAVVTPSGPNLGLYDPKSGMDPAYLPNPIYKDGWWTPANQNAVIQYVRSQAGPPFADYALCSLGKDTKSDTAPAGYLCAGAGPIADILVPVAGVSTTAFDCDITIADGQFMRQPIGKQANATCG